MSREALVLLVCCCDFRDGAERLIPSKSLGNAVIRAFPGLLCILRMCAPRRAVAVVRPRGREKSADRRRRILISRLLIIRVSVPRRKSPFPAYFKGFPAVSPLIPPYPAFLKYPVSPQFCESLKRRGGERLPANLGLLFKFAPEGIHDHIYIGNCSSGHTPSQCSCKISFILFKIECTSHRLFRRDFYFRKKFYIR